MKFNWYLYESYNTDEMQKELEHQMAGSHPDMDNIIKQLTNLTSKYKLELIWDPIKKVLSIKR